MTNVLFIATIQAQTPTISPLETTEQCPNVNITFTVTLPGIYSTINVAPTANSVPPVVVQQPTGITNNSTITTFNFVGKFVDYNNKQTFTVNYYNSSTNT